MAMSYAIVPADTMVLHIIRLLAGGGMAASLILGFAAIRNRDGETHQVWMRRAYAIGFGRRNSSVHTSSAHHDLWRHWRCDANVDDGPGVDHQSRCGGVANPSQVAEDAAGVSQSRRRIKSAEDKK
jgi:hypothetical protein